MNHKFKGVRCGRSFTELETSAIKFANARPAWWLCIGDIHYCESLLTTGFHYWKVVVVVFRGGGFQMQTEISRLISETVVVIFQANAKMLEWGDAFAAPFGLTSARWQILGAIALAGQKQTAPQIAEQMGVSRQGAQKQLNLLADDGLIEKLPNPFHQRSPHYRLTKKGSSLFQRVNQAWQAFAAKTGKAFSAKDLETTLRTLNLISRLHGMPTQRDNDET